jgi:hypothetical protein
MEAHAGAEILRAGGMSVQRALVVKLRGQRLVHAWHAPQAAWEERILRFGGAAAGRVLLARCQEDAVVLAVGDAVRRGLPGAERTSFLWRDPASGRPQQAQGGGAFARRFARHHDALAIEGRLDRPSVLVLGDGVEAVPAPAGFERLDVSSRARWIVDELGGDGWTTGPAASAGLGFATLVSLREPRGSVGRGGLGAALARANVVAIVARDAPVEPLVDERFRAWIDACRASPRLASREAGGTFEAAAAAQARGELGLDEARALLALVEAARAARHGCAGCPTPCGLVFDRPHARQGGRYGAVQLLASRLGLEVEVDALDALRACDELGLDAKEAALRLEARISEAPSDRRARAGWVAATLAEWIERPGRAAAPLEREVERLAGASLATRLALRVSTRGSDPMRVQPFLVDLAAEGRVADLLAPLALPAGALDPRDPRGKGRIVWWCENLALALDATGACAFSAAGLLADGVVDLDGLARIVAPAEALGPASGRGLLALGGALAAMARVAARPPGPRAGDAPEDLLMLEEYGRLRGEGLDWLDPEWGLESAWRRQAEHDEVEEQAASTRLVDVPRPMGGTVHVRALGATFAGLDGSTWSFGEGETARSLLDRLAGSSPGLESQLAAASLWSDGRRVAPAEALCHGATYDLVLALSGG